ncbi:MAG TPA: SIS domain-containing protein [Solirubrobacteraceae bacterium]
MSAERGKPVTTTRPDWYTDEFPELRPGPPWVMQEMIAAEPAVVEALLSDPPAGTSAAAETIAEALEHERPVTVCGCGTSEHAAHAVAALLSAAAGPERGALVRAQPALTAALEPGPGVCVAVSHDGETRATNLALLAAGAAGARTVAITHQAEAGVARAAEHVLVTPLHDESWCHTVAYVSALAAGAAIARTLGAAVGSGSSHSFAADPAAARALVQRASGSPQAAPVANRLADRRVVLCAGAGADLTTARELALKIAEGTRLPTIGLELETVLHGQLAGHEPADAIVLVAIADGAERDRLARRAGDVARAAAAIGMPVAALLSGDYDVALPADLTPAGRLVIDLPDRALLEPRLAGLLAGAGALQSLALELAHARGTNPDLIRREQAPYRNAAHEAESSSDW